MAPPMATKKTEGELSSFRISDMKRAEVRSFSKQSEKKVEEEASSSVGFPAVESRLEGGSIESLAEELRPSYERLEALSSGKGDMKLKAAAKKAMGAYERTADLFEYLYETKNALASGASKG